MLVRVALAWVTCLLLAVPLTARSDGKLFPRTGYGSAETPAQRALIHWAEGIETLVIETTVASAATNLAWVIPLPAPPTEVRVADAGIFPTLQNTFRPRVLYQPSMAWIGGLVVTMLILGLRWSRQRKIRVRLLELLLLVVVLLLLASLLLPALGTAKASLAGAGAAGSTVQQLGQFRAGVFDVTTVSAQRPADLVDWLQTRGFSSSNAAPMEPVIADYLARGWIFAAARVDKPVGPGVARLDPLVFRFPVARPVYPMRLTLLGTSRLACDLYVFGPERATALGWTATYCARPLYQAEPIAGSAEGGLRIRQPSLRALVHEAPVATKLSATLAPSSAAEDVVLQWGFYRSIGQVAHSRQAAWARAAGVVTWGWALAAAVASFYPRPSPTPPPWFNSLDRRGAGVAVLVGVVIWVASPTVAESQIRLLRRFPAIWGRHQAYTHGFWTSDLPEVQAALASTGAISADALRTACAAVGECLRTNAYARQLREDPSLSTNVYTGERLRLEASPGHLTVEPSANGLDLVWHDFEGAPAARHPMERLPPGRR